jgi:hypothetical protein
VIDGNLNSRNRRRQGYVGQEKAQEAQNEPQIDADLRRSGEGKVKSEK